MSLRDLRDVSYSTTNRAALDKFESAAELLHGYYNDPLAEIDAALTEDPEFVMGHCFRAGLMAISTEKAAEPELRHSLDAAEAYADRANERERGHIAALRAWLDGDIERAVEQYGAVLIDHPRDAFALQMAHLGDFLLGQSSLLRDRVARVLPDWDENTPGFGYVLGMHAFGLEEMGDYARAEDRGRQAVSMKARDPWAIHAVAHVMEMQGRTGEGITWLNDRADDWAPDNGFAYHNWWHLALYHLEQGETDRALALYDSAVRPEPSEIVMEMVDASALLWRLCLRGIDVGNRWHELADCYEPMVEDAFYVFNDFHAMMAFVADGRRDAAKKLLAALDRRVSEGGTNAYMTRYVGLPLCQALAAFGEAEFETAAYTLMRIRPNAHRFGGSHAQRDVLTLTLIEAALRGGQPRLARALLAERTSLKPDSAFAWRLTARALSQLQDNAGAEQALSRAGKLAA
ncbi:MAG: tetratricopeptide repeat protein [Alphaproteobacteria bacterium]|nr:tetratricopeptide repeat protein [Alphaproteobacteria bacterium]